MKSRLKITFALVALTGFLALSGALLVALAPSAHAAETAAAGGAIAFGGASYGLLAAGNRDDDARPREPEPCGAHFIADVARKRHQARRLRMRIDTISP